MQTGYLCNYHIFLFIINKIIEFTLKKTQNPNKTNMVAVDTQLDGIRKFLENRVSDLTQKNILSVIPEESLTLLDDAIVTAQLASLFLE